MSQSNSTGPSGLCLLKFCLYFRCYCLCLCYLFPYQLYPIYILSSLYQPSVRDQENQKPDSNACYLKRGEMVHQRIRVSNFHVLTSYISCGDQTQSPMRASPLPQSHTASPHFHVLLESGIYYKKIKNTLIFFLLRIWFPSVLLFCWKLHPTPCIHIPKECGMFR